MKRGFDLFVSFMALFVLFPVIIIVAISIRFSIGKPIIFTQARPGLNGEIFQIFKFRTMTDTKDSSGKFLPDCDRMTRLGEVLRSSSLDELPSLLNVISGKMSLVGPRPLLPEYLPLYSEQQARRHNVRPGLTGWAQVNGRNAISWEEKFALDVWYVDNKTLWLDIKILFMTVKKVFVKEGISADGHVTIEPFTGSEKQGSRQS